MCTPYIDVHSLSILSLRQLINSLKQAVYRAIKLTIIFEAAI